MPFQVVYSTKKVQAGVIDFFTAGDDQITVCDPGATLTATVIGDLTGHTILWEQIVGLPVTFTTPLDQLSVSYTQTTFEDKVFRFWIDKGTGQQQFDDVNVFGAPTFSYYGGVPDNNCIVNFGTSLRCNSPELDIVDAFPTTPISIADCGSSLTQAIRWSAPCDTTGTILQYVVQERSVAGPWTDEAIIPPFSDPTFIYTPSNIGSTYRVVAVVQELNSAISSTPSNSVYVDGIIGTTFGAFGAAATDPLIVANTGSEPNSMKVPTYTVSTLALVNCPPDAPDDYYNSHGQGDPATDVQVPTYSVVTLSLIACMPDAPDDYYNAHGQGDPATDIQVPTYTVLDLTGGDIGG